MKKFMAVLAAMMMVFALAACGGDKEPAKQGGDTNDVNEVELCVIKVN